MLNFENNKIKIKKARLGMMKSTKS